MFALEEHQLIYRIHFGSCLNQNLEQPIWSKILSRKINHFIFLGDAVYGDDQSESLNLLNNAYKIQGKQIPFKNIKKIDAIWDDHDYGENDGGISYLRKKESKKLFLDFWKIKSNDLRHKRAGLYFSKSIKLQQTTIQLIFLDVRWFKVIKENNQNTLLGEQQWQWLQTVIKEPSDFKIIISPIQVLTTLKREGWHQFPEERENLLKLITEQSKKTLLISGDRHQGSIYKIEFNGKEIIEFTTSGMNLNDKKIIPEPFRVSKPIIQPHILEIDFFKNKTFTWKYIMQ